MRTILAIDPTGFDPVTKAPTSNIRIEDSPFNVSVREARQSLPFDLSLEQLPAWGIPNGVRERGRLIRDSLRKHPGVAAVMDLLSSTQKGSIRPLYISLAGAEEAELVCWETLCDANDSFFALDRRWPIGRIAKVNGESRRAAEWASPVRMLACISALGINDQQQEWENLREAVRMARQDGLEVKLKIMTGNPVLYQAIQDDMNGGAKDFEVEGIPASVTAFKRSIQNWQPNILHFFCHGTSDHSGQYLDIAVATDYNPLAASGSHSGSLNGSLRIRTEILVDIGAQLRNPWLLTLNCCSGSKPAKNLNSIAKQAVSIFPAVVAMSEPVDANDAFEFSGAYYRALFLGLQRDSRKANGRRFAFEWIEAMYDARQAIVSRHNTIADANPFWTLPNLYVWDTAPFHFEPPPVQPMDSSQIMSRILSALGKESPAKQYSPEEDARFKVEAGEVAKWLSTAGRQQSEEYRLGVMKEVLAKVPEAYWPSVDGRFPGGV